MIPVHEKQLLDRVRDYASSVMVRETPWLGLLMIDIIVELTEAADEIEKLRHGSGYDLLVENLERANAEIERLRKELEHQRSETKRYREILISLRVEWVD
jgi:hypothetical protein